MDEGAEITRAKGAYIVNHDKPRSAPRPEPVRAALQRMMTYLDPDTVLWRRAEDGSPVSIAEMEEMLDNDDPAALDFLEDMAGAWLRISRIHADQERRKAQRATARLDLEQRFCDELEKHPGVLARRYDDPTRDRLTNAGEALHRWLCSLDEGYLRAAAKLTVADVATAYQRAAGGLRDIRQYLDDENGGT